MPAEPKIIGRFGDKFIAYKTGLFDDLNNFGRYDSSDGSGGSMIATADFTTESGGPKFVDASSRNWTGVPGASLFEEYNPKTQEEILTRNKPQISAELERMKNYRDTGPYVAPTVGVPNGQGGYTPVSSTADPASLGGEIAAYYADKSGQPSPLTANRDRALARYQSQADRYTQKLGRKF